MSKTVHVKAILTSLVLGGALLLYAGSTATALAQDRGSGMRHSSPTAAPAKQEAENDSDESGFLAVGTQFADLGSLNGRLEDAGYPTFGSEILSIGIGGRRAIGNRWFIGAEVTGMFSPSQGFEGRDVSLAGFRLMPTLGYTFRPTQRLRVYPEVGIGVEAALLDIGASGEASNFEGVLSDPGRSATLARGSLVARIGAGADYKLTGPDGQARLGVQAGYALPALSSDWELSGGSTLSGGPDSTLGGFYLRLLIDDLL
ncbi:MAG: hypothetical protein ABEL04_00795 [Salinibacter sp.]|uniref:hypothetical protein n=1 Tax=Salinibacter sp. TaxID=2065818 RepID=UPI0035D4F17A